MANTPANDGKYDFKKDPNSKGHLVLLGMEENNLRHGVELEETRTTPLFSMEVGEMSKRNLPGNRYPFSQYGLLAGRIGSVCKDDTKGRVGSDGDRRADPRIFLNVSAPWSAFICGSQGSGKSHSLACMLENCLMPQRQLGSLPNPLTAIIFHYDPLASVAGQVCEAVYLCSARVKVKVLVSPTSYHRMAKLYKNLEGLPQGCQVIVEPLILKQEYLNVDRLKTFMATDSSEGLPLYMQSVLSVLREMASDPKADPGIDYKKFKDRIARLDLSPSQKLPLALRLELMEEFIEDHAKGKPPKRGNDWTPSHGQLIILDLSCQFLDVNTACTLFDIYLGVFLEQKPSIGRLVALDEAHKFMTDTPGAQKLTESLLSLIRLQRHSACRIIIATQEPTISPKLLDLCSFTLVHRFTSPDWLRTLKSHLVPAAVEAAPSSTTSKGVSPILAQIVDLNVGEALLFAPSAMLDVERTTDEKGKEDKRVKKLGLDYLTVRIRTRVTVDRGKSIMAS